MAGDLLRDFDSATVFQIRRDPSRPEEETFILWGLLGLAGTFPCGTQITGAITGSVVDVTYSEAVRHIQLQPRPDSLFEA